MKRFVILSRRPKVAWSVTLLMAALYPAFCWVVMEFCNPRSGAQLLEYCVSRVGRFAWAWGVFTLLMLVLAVVTRRLWVSMTVVNVLFFAATYANYFKKLYWGSPVVPDDLVLAGDALKANAMLNLVPTGRMVAMLGAMVFATGICAFVQLPKLFEEKRRKKLWRAGLSLALTVVLVVYFLFAFFAVDPTAAYAPSVHGWTTDSFSTLYYQGTFFTSFFTLMNPDRIRSAEPLVYTQENLALIEEGLQQTADRMKITTQPDVIVVLLETYADPMIFDDVAFSKDLTPNFDRLAAEGISGNIISPVYGGGTSDAEFEVLTGIASKNAYVSSVAYWTYVYEGFPGIVEYLNGRGYRTMAMHAHTNEMFNRPTAYENLGFGGTLFRDQFSSVEYVREYASDACAVAQIIETHRTMTQAESGPVFLNMVSMQNHSTYYNAYERMTAQGIEMVGVEKAGLDPQAQQMLSAYATLLLLTDESLGTLTDYLRTSDRDVVLVVYGDHQSGLTSEDGHMNVLEQTDFFNLRDGEQAKIDQRRTPYLVWTNFDTSHGGETYGTLPLNLLLPYALHTYEAPRPVYFEYLYEQSQAGEIVGFSGDYAICADGTIRYSELADEQAMWQTVALRYDITGKKLQLEDSLYE